MKRFFSSQAIQLSSDDEDELGNSSLASEFGGCVPCLPCLAPLTGGTIQLTAEDATLNSYLDPSTTTTIEPLLEEYSHQDKDSAFNRATLHNSYQFLTRNPFASSSSSVTKATISSGYKDDSYHEQHDAFAGALPRVDFFMENDDAGDAEFLSDHRISAVIGDTSKLAAQLELFDSQAGNEQEDGDTSSLDDDDANKGDGTAFTRPFEIRNDWSQDIDSINDEHRYHSDPDELQPLDDSLLDANAIGTINDKEITHEQLVESSITSDIEPIQGQNDMPIVNGAKSPCGSNSSDNLMTEQPPFNNDFLYSKDKEVAKDVLNGTAPLVCSPPSPLPSSSTDYTEKTSRSLPSTGLPRSAIQAESENDGPLLSNIIHITKYEASRPPSNDINTSYESTMETSRDNGVMGKRRSSVAAVAHSLLGDKLDDFTEKLAYIRKNIIMSLDDDDDDDQYNEDNTNTTSQQQLRRSRSGSMQTDGRRQSYDPLVSKPAFNEPSSRPNHRRSSSMMDLAPSFAKIVQQHIEGHNDYRHFSPSSFFASLAGPDLSSDENNHPSSALPSQQPYPHSGKDTDALSDVDEDQEDLFDFSKVIEMGKNVRHYSEDLMGNGMRLFNDFSTRMKNANTSSDALLSMDQQTESPQQDQSSMDQEFLLGDTFF